MKLLDHIIGNTPEQIAETDREFLRYFVDLYDSYVRRLDQLRIKIDQVSSISRVF